MPDHPIAPTGTAGDQLKIERPGFRGIAHEHDPLAVGALNIRRAFAPGKREQGKQ